MNPNIPQTILLVGSDQALHYLLGRFVEESKCILAVLPVIASAQEITDINPKSIIFLSREHLVAAQTLMTELTSMRIFNHRVLGSRGRKHRKGIGRRPLPAPSHYLR